MWRGWERSRSRRGVLVRLEAHHLAARKPDGTLRREVKGKKRPFVARSGPAWALLGPHSATRPCPHPLPAPPLCVSTSVSEEIPPPPSPSPFTSFWISLPSPPYLLSSFRSAPSTFFQPFFFLGLSRSTHERLQELESRLSRCFLEIRLSTSSSSTSSTSNTPGCVLYTLTTESTTERPTSPPPFVSTRIHMYGVCGDANVLTTLRRYIR